MNTHIKIRFDLSEWGPKYEEDLPAGETLWAEVLADNLFRLKNIPMFVDGFAVNDVVRCVNRDGWYHVTQLVEDGGHGTIFLKFFAGVPEDTIIDFLHSIVTKGCTFEKMANLTVAVNVPPYCAAEFTTLVSERMNTLIEDTFAPKPPKDDAITP